MATVSAAILCFIATDLRLLYQLHLLQANAQDGTLNNMAVIQLAECASVGTNVTQPFSCVHVTKQPPQFDSANRP